MAEIRAQHPIDHYSVDHFNSKRHIVDSTPGHDPILKKRIENLKKMDNIQEVIQIIELGHNSGLIIDKILKQPVWIANAKIYRQENTEKIRHLLFKHHEPNKVSEEVSTRLLSGPFIVLLLKGPDAIKIMCDFNAAEPISICHSKTISEAQQHKGVWFG